MDFHAESTGTVDVLEGNDHAEQVASKERVPVSFTGGWFDVLDSVASPIFYGFSVIHISLSFWHHWDYVCHVENGPWMPEESAASSFHCTMIAGELNFVEVRTTGEEYVHIMVLQDDGTLRVTRDDRVWILHSMDELWPQYVAGDACCSGAFFMTVPDRFSCQQMAVGKQHTFYQWARSYCFTTNTCVPKTDGCPNVFESRWRIYAQPGATSDNPGVEH